MYLPNHDTVCDAEWSHQREIQCPKQRGSQEHTPTMIEREFLFVPVRQAGHAPEPAAHHVGDRPTCSGRWTRRSPSSGPRFPFPGGRTGRPCRRAPPVLPPVRRRVRCGPRAGRPCRRAPPVRPVHVTRRQRVRRQAARQAARSNYGAAPRRRGPRVNRADRGRTRRANAPLPIFSCQPRRACAA